MGLGVLVSVGVAAEKLIAEQPLVPDNSSVSQTTKVKEKSAKREMDTVIDTSNKGDIYVEKTSLIL
jgi:hypothetical protein